MDANGSLATEELVPGDRLERSDLILPPRGDDDSSGRHDGCRSGTCRWRVEHGRRL